MLNRPRVAMAFRAFSMMKSADATANSSSWWYWWIFFLLLTPIYFLTFLYLSRIVTGTIQLNNCSKSRSLTTSGSQIVFNIDSPFKEKSNEYLSQTSYERLILNQKIHLMTKRSRKSPTWWWGRDSRKNSSSRVRCFLFLPTKLFLEHLHTIREAVGVSQIWCFPWVLTPHRKTTCFY